MVNPRPAQSEDTRVRALHEDAVATYGRALRRLARAYEADPERRQDVLQEVHLALWQSLSRFDGRCALGTWVYRVAHNATALLNLSALTTSTSPGPTPIVSARSMSVARSIGCSS